MGYRLLVVGGGKELTEAVRGFAAEANYSLEATPNGAEGVKRVLAEAADAALVSGDLPDMQGLAWLRMVKATQAGADLPVLLLSATKSDVELADAYDAGADDFIQAPCQTEELAARVRAVLRRRHEREEQVGCAVALGSVSLDPARHECRVRGKLVRLRPREFELLEILMRKAGRVLSRVYLLETIWGMSRLADTRAVDVGVSRLRAALGRRAARWLETVERFGYRFRTE